MYGKEVQFLLVYIREAHPEGSARPMPVPGHGTLDDPKTDAERATRAGACISGLGLDHITTVVDGIDNKVGAAWAAWPDRLFLVGKDGRITFVGAPGPRGFLPDDLETAIKKELNGSTDSRPGSDSRPAR